MLHAPAELDAVDDVAPLVGAAHLQHAAVAARQLDEIVGLEDHVVEFEEGQLVLALEPELDRLHRQHAVDREMPADIAQEIDVVERGEPLGIVDHQRAGRPVVEIEEAGKDRAEALLVGLDLVIGEELPRLVLARGIADPGGAAAHQRDRLVAGLLQPAQHHDREEMADMERRPGAVVADIGDDGRLERQRIEPLGVGALMDKSALEEDAHEVGLESGHSSPGIKLPPRRRGKPYNSGRGTQPTPHRPEGSELR